MKNPILISTAVYDGYVAIYYHILDVASDDSGWYLIVIGKGPIDKQKNLKGLAVLQVPVPISLEIPARIRRATDASPRRASQPVALAEIRQVMTGSVNFVKQVLFGQTGLARGSVGRIARYLIVRIDRIRYERIHWLIGKRRTYCHLGKNHVKPPY